jgi:Flp pilus assembly protein TadD
MRRYFRHSTLTLAVLFALTAGCASAPSTSNDAFADDELRDTDRDIIFATEFPVAGKADALARADAAKNSGELDRALFFYVKALQFDPQDVNLLATIGLLHQYRGNDKLAVNAYTLALDIDPDYAKVLEARGLIFLAHTENERALSDLTRATEIDPESWRAHNGLGLLADRMSDHDAAIPHYDKALALKPNSGDILNNRGYSLLLAERYTDAYDDLFVAAESLGHKQAWVNLGTLYARIGRYDLAVEAFEEVLPEPEAFNRVAEASMLKGDFATAETLLEQAIQLSPTYFPAAEDNLAQLKLKTGGS